MFLYTTIIMHDLQEHVALARVGEIEMLITSLFFHDCFSAVLCMVFWSIFHC